MDFLSLFNCGQSYSSMWTEQVPSHPVAEAAPMRRTQARTDMPCRREPLCSATRLGGQAHTDHSLSFPLTASHDTITRHCCAFVVCSSTTSSAMLIRKRAQQLVPFPSVLWPCLDPKFL